MSAGVTDTINLNVAADVLSALGNAVRLRMIKILLTEEVPVSELGSKVGLAQAATSQHVKRLMEAGLVTERLIEQLRFCSLKKEKVDFVIRLIFLAEHHYKNTLDDIRTSKCYRSRYAILLSPCLLTAQTM